MRLISKSDVEAIQLSNLVIKSNGHRAYQKMQQAWQNDRTNTDTAFLFATCAFAFVYEESIAPDRHRYLSHAIDAFSDCINQRNDWWMARFMRGVALQAIVISSAEQSLQDVYEDDCEVLIKQQMKSSKKEPYFLCPYLMVAKSNIFEGKIDYAIEIAERGLQELTHSEVVYPLNILLQPFGDAIAIFRNIGRDDLAERIKYVGLSLFPRSISLASF
ncbi:hypothetical protein PV797_10540 [Clostridiaceae bacterium M8S5]|nr:hypothetical protein PV797_10540 [Clostridiaceae bacterium M8S5]